MRIMVSFKRLALCLILISSIVVVAAGCKSSGAASGNYRSFNGVAIDSQLLASNSEHELYWDKDAGAVLLKSKKTGKCWSDILYDSYLEGSTSANGNSPINITVSNNQTLKWDTVRSYTEMNESGKIICKKIKDGIRVTYFFDRYKIAVPVDYTLNDNCLEVSIEGSQILEDGSEFKLVSVNLTPFLCSVSNQAEGGYLFVPTGSGALMYAKETPDGRRSYIGEVYGEDASRRLAEDYTDGEAIKLPIFGASDGERALLGVIEQSAGAAFIEAQAGNDRLGYSNVGATFYFRGYDTFRYGSHGTGNVITQRVGDNLIKRRASVKYYPLYGENANYNGMAQKYREYLLENNILKKSKTEDSPYSLTFLGGTTVPTSVLGIPKNKLVSMTNFAQGLEIVKDLTSKTGTTPVVRLMNYGDGGMLPGSMGSKRIPSVFGKRNQLKSLNDYCLQQGSGFFMDSEIVYYTKSRLGFSVNMDSARTVIKYKAQQFNVSPIRKLDEENPNYVLSRRKLATAVKNALDKARKYSLSGISFSSIGYTAYSDYKDGQYAFKGSMENDVASIFGTVSSAGYKTATSAANLYAACAADVLFDTPSANGKYDVFDEYIPFYQMVFHSYKSMYSVPVNLAENYDETVLRAALSGMGLSYYIIHDYIPESNDLSLFKLYGTVYKDNLGKIVDTLNKASFNQCYTAVKDAVFLQYNLPENGISQSHFSNGVTIYANHTSKAVDSPAGKIAPYGYAVK